MDRFHKCTCTESVWFGSSLVKTLFVFRCNSANIVPFKHFSHVSIATARNWCKHQQRTAIWKLFLCVFHQCNQESVICLFSYINRERVFMYLVSHIKHCIIHTLYYMDNGYTFILCLCHIFYLITVHNFLRVFINKHTRNLTW